MQENLILATLSGVVIGGLVGSVVRAGCLGRRWVSFLIGVLTGGALGVLLVLSVRQRPAVGRVEADAASSVYVRKVESKEEYYQSLKTNRFVLVHFCSDKRENGHAREVVRELADAHSGRVQVIEVDVDRLPDVATLHGVTFLPDVRVYRKGEIEGRVVGRREKKDYLDALGAALADLEPSLAPFSERKEIKMTADESMKGKVHDLASYVGYQRGAVVSKTLLDKPTGTLTLFAFDRGQGLSEHTSPYDATVQIVDGEARITVGGKEFVAHAGEFVIMPAGVPHALRGEDRFKMLLIMIR